MEEKSERGRGRPPITDKDPEIKARIVGFFAATGKFELACDACGISRSTGYRWREEDSEFRDALTRERAAHGIRRVQTIYEMGEKDLRAAELYLNRWGPEELRPPKEEAESGTFTYKHVVGGAVVEEQVFTRTTAQDSTPEPEVKE